MSGLNALIKALVDAVTNYESILAAFGAAVPEFALTASRVAPDDRKIKSTAPSWMFAFDPTDSPLLRLTGVSRERLRPPVGRCCCLSAGAPSRSCSAGQMGWKCAGGAVKPRSFPVTAQEWPLSQRLLQDRRFLHFYTYKTGA